MGQFGFMLAIVCVVGALFCGANGDEDSPGSPLFLTPYLDDDRLIEARMASRVPSLIDGEQVESYSGYFTVDDNIDSNMFFWFFPCESNRANAPVVLWLQGGPGGSSLYATFTENGPFSITEDLKLTRRDIYWSQSMHVLYIDNPVGTGFSFTGDESGYATNENDVANNLYNSLVQFFKLFPELADHDFFITGESYAGKYIPYLAQKIDQMNSNATRRINMKGVAIGDGWIDPRNMMVYSDYLYEHGIIDDRTAAVMSKLENETIGLIDQKDFHNASVMSDKILDLMSKVSGPINVYDYLKTDGVGSDEDDIRIDQFLNLTSVRKSLHVGNQVYDDGMLVAQYLYDDETKSAAPALEAIIDKYRVLLYNGQLDIIVAYPLTLNFVKHLKWDGVKDYLKAERKLWHVGNDLAGLVKTSKTFTELLVRNAGHMVPANQPLWALDMITRFVYNIPFDKPYSSSIW